MQTIFWHDYETFGADPQKDFPCQFAGVRTDLNLNIIEESVTLYSKPNEDYLPSVQACLITGITPQEASNKGLSEAAFADKIHALFSKPETCVAGYNSVRFDDEVSRNLFYRNLHDPYEREWKNGNSRWDLIDVVRLTHALRPEGINWPIGDEGKVSFRLEKLTEANGIAHEAAHDAMSDVYATIAVAKLIRDKQPALYNYAFGMRTKQAVMQFFEENDGQPFIHVSSKIPVANGCCAMMYPIAPHPSNKNALIAFDLRQAPSVLLEHSSSEIRDMLYQKSILGPDGLPKNIRPALKLIHMNKCPMVAKASMIKVIPEERLEQWSFDLNQMREHLKILRNSRDALKHVPLAFERSDEGSGSTDPDLMIYSGGFFSPNDRNEMSRLRAVDRLDLADIASSFQDPRLDEMFFRYKARSFPESLNSDERERWQAHCSERLLSPESQFRTFDDFARELQSAAAGIEPGSPQSELLQELHLYAESIYPY